MNLSIIIPTLEAEKYLPQFLKELGSQSTQANEIIVIDSASADQTSQIAIKHGCILEVIPRKSFRHGKTRNLGARLAQGEILVFLTQDSLPAHSSFLESLTKPILTGEAAAVTARQIPYPHTNPIERLNRNFNYPVKSSLRTWGDVSRLGIKALFFSNAASAIDRKVFWDLGGFSESVIVDEDLEFCARLLKAGYSVRYNPEASVYHSHNYNLTQLFKRYYDTGIFFNQAEELLNGIPLNQEGWRYLSQVTRGLIKTNKYPWIIRFYLEVGVKYTAFQLGKHYYWFPNRLNSRLSGQPYYWLVES